jgi:alanyl-tRNA synthetase
MAEEQGLKINQAEFEAAQKASKEASKGLAKKSDAEVVRLDVHDIASLEKNADVPKTNDEAKYGRENVTAKVKAIYDARAFHPSSEGIAPGKVFGVILDKTCFYAESGGQENDTGIISIDGKVEFEVEDVQVFNGYVLHIGTLKEGQLSLEDEVVCTYDELRRWPIRNNHTATHILNYGLREVLGDHIDQRGSLVAPSKLRFDFSHKGPVTLQEMEKIEAICNDWIKRNVKVFSKELQLKEAHKIPGLRAVFGEAYPDPVRVVVLEFDVDEVANDIENPKWRKTSVEFCGGT